METLQTYPSNTDPLFDVPAQYAECPGHGRLNRLHHANPAECPLVAVVKSSPVPVSPAPAAPESAPRTILITRTTRATGKAVRQAFHSLRGAHEFIATGLFENTSMRKGMCDDAAELIMGQRELLRQTQFGPFLFTVDKTNYLRD